MVEGRLINLVQDYPLLKSWWDERKFPAPDPQFMPPTGVLVSIDGLPTCAGFLFKSDANAAIMGNIVSNPKATGKERSLALDALFGILAKIAQEAGFGMLCCSTNLPRLMERFEKHDFVKTDSGVSNFGRVL